MPEQDGTYLCACAALSRIFGAAPRCSSCLRQEARNRLIADGFVEVDRAHLQAYRDCGVTVHTLVADRSGWAPCWAEQLRQLFQGTYYLGPLLGRCAVDTGLAEALVSCKAIVEKQCAVTPPYVGGSRERAVFEKVLALAIELGALPEPGVR